MGEADPRGAFQLRLQVASTPERVSEAANWFGEILRDVYPQVPSGSVTMVVNNLDMTAGMRWQDKSGKRAIDGIIRFASNPNDEANKHPESSWVMAEVFAEHGELFKDCNAELWTPKRKLASVNDEFVGEMRRLATEKRPAPVMRGDTILYSAVHRVGRSSHNARHATARIDVDGRPVDIPIVAGKEFAFFDAAKSRALVSIRVHVSWIRSAQGKLIIDPRRSRITNLEDWSPITGNDLMQEVGNLPVDMFSDLDYLLDDA